MRIALDASEGGGVYIFYTWAITQLVAAIAQPIEYQLRRWQPVWIVLSSFRFPRLEDLMPDHGNFILDWVPTACCAEDNVSYGS
jgi:hypothetical protein